LKTRFQAIGNLLSCWVTEACCTRASRANVDVMGSGHAIVESPSPASHATRRRKHGPLKTEGSAALRINPKAWPTRLWNAFPRSNKGGAHCQRNGVGIPCAGINQILENRMGQRISPHRSDGLILSMRIKSKAPPLKWRQGRATQSSPTKAGPPVPKRQH
jgi:hypothetical protein